MDYTFVRFAKSDDRVFRLLEVLIVEGCWKDCLYG